jgi:hypothetical protein
MRKQTKLPLIDEPHPKATVLDNRGPPGALMPAGTDAEDLLCGKCGVVLAPGHSLEGLKALIVVDAQFVLKCGCGAYNLAPAQVQP